MPEDTPCLYNQEFGDRNEKLWRIFVSHLKKAALQRHWCALYPLTTTGPEITHWRSATATLSDDGKQQLHET